MPAQLTLTPQGRLTVEEIDPTDEETAKEWLSSAAARLLAESFSRSSGDGLLMLAGPTLTESFPPDFLFWREWAGRFFQSLCQLDDDALAAFCKTAAKSSSSGSKSASLPDASSTARRTDILPPPDALELAIVIANAPPMKGLEYLTGDVLQSLWNELADVVRRRISNADGSTADVLREVNPQWHLLGRVTFHLAENKNNPSQPFAFLATYAHRLSARGKVQHLPLAQALRQYAGEKDRAKLAELLTPVRMAGEQITLVQELLTSRELFQPQAWTIAQAYRFLRDVPLMEQSGLAVRVPNWWQRQRPPRPQVQIRIGDQKPSAFGTDQLINFSVQLALDGEPLTDSERRQLLGAEDGLLLLKGKWVEVDNEKLRTALQHFEELQESQAGGIDFLKGMRMLAGTTMDSESADANNTPDWSSVVAGDWLSDMLQQLRDPSGVVGCSPGHGLHATLRPYQEDGVRWLWFLAKLGFGACLADDMGLGKTIQVIDLLLRLRDTEETSGKQRGGRKAACPSLLIVPASLVGNWKQEFAKFAPQLKVFCAHRSECDAETLSRVEADPASELADFDAVVTTYTYVRRTDWPSKRPWRIIVLDEAQAIKNATSAQTKAIKKLDSKARIVLTGTPVENQLGDLWSLFDFCCPGLLGSARQFKSYVKLLNQQQNSSAYGPLRRLVQPYILRRMKTDPKIVPDLPDKTEVKVTCGLSKKQAVLYEDVVRNLQKQLETADGIKRRGIVLASLMKLKQICNHPSQFLNQRLYPSDDSAKFLRLSEICGEILARQEKVLVFTQYQSICDPLSDHLRTIFHRPGLILHGGVPVAKRKTLVKQFQEDNSIPYFIISVKAGGTGLNLTAASHVIHFDRWWNPAVENQATDRAFRIGQQRNVLVHKFVCRGTVEERIDEMLHDKQHLADEILGKSNEGEVLLTEMTDGELMKFVSLDLSRATTE